MPLHSLSGPSDAATETMQDGLYLTELDRQAGLASRALADAWLLAMGPSTPADDPAVWGDLQAAMFAAILIERILVPTHRARAHSGLSASASNALMATRGARLRALVGVDEADSQLFQVSSVRDRMEHFDEQLDALVASRAVSVSDWYISDGGAITTDDDRAGFGLRIFDPLAGYLHLGDATLDLFTLDHALRELRKVGIPDARKKLEEKRRASSPEGGYNTLAGKLVTLTDREVARDRCERWLASRTASGDGLGVTVSPV